MQSISCNLNSIVSTNPKRPQMGQHVVTSPSTFPLVALPFPLRLLAIALMRHAIFIHRLLHDVNCMVKCARNMSVTGTFSCTNDTMVAPAEHLSGEQPGADKSRQGRLTLLRALVVGHQEGRQECASLLAELYNAVR